MPAVTLEEARRMAQRGQFPAARTAYRKLIERQPSDTALLLECAAIDARSGQFKSSRRMLQQALKLAPDDPDIHFNLGEVARNSGAAEIAVGHYCAAQALAPDDADICYGLGEALAETGELGEARELLERAAVLAPRDAEVHNALGIAREAVGDGTGALAAYRGAVAIDAEFRDGWCNLALASHRAELHEDAAAAFERTHALSRGKPPSLVLLPWARTLMDLQRFDEALALLDEAIEQGIEPAVARLVRGQIEQQLGDFDAAEASFRETLRLNSSAGDGYEKLARMRRLGTEAMPAIEALLANEAVDKAMRAPAGFALYWLLEQAGKTDAAFAALERANALKAAAIPFDQAKHDQACERVMSVFDSAFFEARAGQGVASQAPIFILGMPRSGTTLTEQILAAYPSVRAGGERQDIQEAASRIADYPVGCRDVDGDWAMQQGERILARMLGSEGPPRFATNKAPGNYAFVGLIAWLFPNARIIYCKRDPRDIGLSSLEQNFRAGLAYTYDQRAFAHVYKQHEQLMRHWFEVSPIPIHTVQYEELATDPETAARPMIEYCGLEWRQESLQTHMLDRPIDTASLWQVRQPINTSSIGKWKRYEKQLQPMIEALGEP